jgi:hypothetical protein
MELHDFFTGRTGPLLDVALLIALMYFIARHEAEWELPHHLYGNPKILLVFIPQLLAYRVCSTVDFYEVFALIALLVSLLLCLRFLFFATWPKAALIVACYLPYMIFITIMIHRDRSENATVDPIIPLEDIMPPKELQQPEKNINTG